MVFFMCLTVGLGSWSGAVASRLVQLYSHGSVGKVLKQNRKAQITKDKHLSCFCLHHICYCPIAQTKLHRQSPSMQALSKDMDTKRTHSRPRNGYMCHILKGTIPFTHRIILQVAPQLHPYQSVSVLKRLHLLAMLYVAIPINLCSCAYFLSSFA